MYICDMYEQSLKYHCQRYSNNSKPLFSDEEILTIYFFVGHEQKYTLIKDIHNFAKEYLREPLPNLDLHDHNTLQRSTAAHRRSHNNIPVCIGVL